MPVIKDQMERKVDVPDHPERIVSLVPSQTELLFDLGLEDRIVGVTDYCIHPADKTCNYPTVGGTKNVSLKKVKDLEPDLIIGNKEENNKRKIEKLAERWPVWLSEIYSLNDALQMIREVGEITATSPKAESLISNIQKGFENLAAAKDVRRVAYLIWKNPYMVAGSDTFINEVLKRCGWSNVFELETNPSLAQKWEEKGISHRYPAVSAEEIQSVNPDLILLSSEPYSFTEDHLPEFQAMVPNADVKVVDGEIFSWFGSRLLKASDYLSELT